MFFIKGIFTYISTGMHPVFPGIILTATYSNTLLKERLVVRRRRSASPLTATRLMPDEKSHFGLEFLSIDNL